MQEPAYPHPPSHRTFDFPPVTLDSNFDSGNLFNAEKVNATTVPPLPRSSTSGWPSTTPRTNTGRGSTSPCADCTRAQW